MKCRSKFTSEIPETMSNASRNSEMSNVFPPPKLIGFAREKFIGLTDAAIIAPEALPETCRGLDAGTAKVLKAGHSTQVYDIGNLIVKRYPLGSLGKRLRYCFRSRARRNLAIAEKLGKIGVNTPRIVSIVRQIRAGLPQCDYLLQVKLDPEKFTFGDRMNEYPAGIRQEWLKIAVELLAKMHRAGLSHGDASMRNLYFFTADGKWQAGVIDLDGAKSHAGSRDQLRDLSRLLSSFAIVGQTENALETLSETMLEFYRQCGGKSFRLEHLLAKNAEFLRRTRRG